MVTAVVDEWPGVREVSVDVADDGVIAALAYVDLVGRPEPGDRVLLNTTALSMNLGTGGHALVVALPDRLPADPVGARPHRESPLHAFAGHRARGRRAGIAASRRYCGREFALRDAGCDRGPAFRVAGRPRRRARRPPECPRRLCADRWRCAAAVVLPTVASITIVLCGTVSTGQAFGGDLESVTVHTGLLAARHVLDADVAIVTQGPGNLGTGTPWGFSGVLAGEVVNAVAVLDGHPVGALRISDADPRERHRGLSHHTVTAFGRVALARAELVVPTGLAPDLAGAVASDLAPLRARHTIVTVDTRVWTRPCADCRSRLSTMGRSLDEDHAYFLAAAAAGRHAAAQLP